MVARNFLGGAAATTLNGGISSGASSIVLTDGSTYPTANFTIVIDRGLVGEEKVFISSRSTNTLTVSSRGYDGTTASAHSSGAAVEHCGTALDFQETNDHVNGTGAAHTGASLSPGTLVIPGAASPAQTAEGSAVWDTDDDVLTIGTGAARKTQVNTDSTQTLTNKTLTSPTVSGGTFSGAQTFSGTQAGMVLDAASTHGGVSGTTLAADHAAYGTWSPTLSNIAIGNGTVVARYLQVGKQLHFEFMIGAGTTTSWSSGPGFTLPVAPKSAGLAQEQRFFLGYFYDTSALQGYPLFVFSSAASAAFVGMNTSVTVGQTVTIGGSSPAALASGDFIYCSGVYEVA